MSDIIVDNWTLQRAAVSIDGTCRNSSKPNIEYIKLIEAIILWDNIYYVDNEYSSYWKDILKNYGFDQFLVPLRNIFESDEEYRLCTQHAKFLALFQNNLVAQGAIEYRSIADQICIGYLPSKERAEFLANTESNHQYITRFDAMNCFEKSVLEFYGELNKLMGSNRIRFEFPVLFDYVRSQSSSRYYVEQALAIKNTPEVRAFRDCLDEFERDVVAGNFVMIKSYLDEISKVVNSIRKPQANKQIKGELHLSFSPSLIPTITPKFSASITVPLRNRGCLHLDFLRILADYSTKNRQA